MQDLDDALMTEEALEEDDPARFREARDGNHLLTPFQLLSVSKYKEEKCGGIE
jgi:hypothetical protein